MSQKENWVWMPHAGHLIVGDQCIFHLNTYVGGYVVSTVGEYWPDQQVRRIHAEVHDPQWYAENRDKKGDMFDAVYRRKFGFEDIGADRTYETMVFKATRETNPAFMCCPWTMKTPSNLDFDAYSDAVDAYKGHLAMCKKWAAGGPAEVKVWA